MLKLVPFNPVWIDNSRIDIHGIYRRPRFVEDEYGERHLALVDGVPLWDLTSPLPIRLHNKWTAKGFEYVTLANRESLRTASMTGTLHGSEREYDQHQTGGPWNYRKYLDNLKQSTAEAEALAKQHHEKLKADVEKYGWEVVEEIRKQIEPGFTVPESMKASKKGKVA